MNKKTLEDMQVSGRKVLVRVDFNVPLNKEHQITDDNRIQAALPTIRYLLKQNAKIILMSHLGRPSGTGFEADFSMAPVARRLAELLKLEVKLAADVIGDDAKSLVKNMKESEVVLLENLRFHKEETKNDPEFAKQLASLAEIYV
ncbi:MAG TPA: phosphoglycerate kinase, partial [Clostridiales bacterium]|nr:phosphoglycerate kinase [Clostridiales bacterium]